MAITLKAARVNKNLTQKDAASALGISEESLRNYEQGKTFPDVGIVKKMEDLYQVEYNDLIFLPNETV